MGSESSMLHEFYCGAKKRMFKFLETAAAVIQSLTSYNSTSFGSPWISEVALSRYKSYLEYSGLGLL